MRNGALAAPKLHNTHYLRAKLGVPAINFAQLWPRLQTGSVTDLLTHDVTEAVRALRAGGLVALPTETVYGLAARARSPEAVGRIFATKGRPADHPVIVHLAHPEDLDQWATEIPPWARRLAGQCWPGPLTLIVPRAPDVGDYLTGGQDTVGLRVPGHPVTHDVLVQLGDAVAAPSANRFGQVSPTTAAHVLSELGGELDPSTDRILDAGPCPIGVESTIVDATGPAPRLLRPGSITAETIAEVTGLELQVSDGRVRAPGTLATHYSPRATVVLSTPETLDSVLKSTLITYPQGEVGLVSLASVAPPDVHRVSPLLRSQTEADLAQGLYAALRRADDQGMTAIIAVLPPDTGVGSAIRDRLQRAAAQPPEAPIS